MIPAVVTNLENKGGLKVFCAGQSRDYGCGANSLNALHFIAGGGRSTIIQSEGKVPVNLLEVRYRLEWKLTVNESVVGSFF